MNNKHLYLITFDYLGCKCYLPRIFDITQYTKDNEKIILCNKVIASLKNQGLVENLLVYPVHIGSDEDVYNTFLDILNAPNPKVQYLNIETRVLSEPHYDQLFDTAYYLKMTISQTQFPVRVFDKLKDEDTDELKLPLIVIEKEDNTNN